MSRSIPKPVSVWDVVGAPTSHLTRKRHAQAYADIQGTADEPFATSRPESSTDFDRHVDQALSLVREA